MLSLIEISSLTIGAPIRAIVAAHNANGWGAFSEPNVIGQVI
jgi:hypothetical protein